MSTQTARTNRRRRRGKASAKNSALSAPLDHLKTLAQKASERPHLDPYVPSS
jgi:hypothetical protein